MSVYLKNMTWLSTKTQGETGYTARAFTPRILTIVLLVYIFSVVFSQVYGQVKFGGSGEPIYQLIWKWAPLLITGPPGELGGFSLNLVVSFLAMTIGTAVGLVLGLGQVSLLAPIRKFSWIVTQFFRNSPWLVLLFFMMLLMPFRFNFMGTTVEFPGWIKATIGLALPIMANVSEIVRGAVNSIPTGQWESADSLAFSRSQTLWRIILPQCIKRMIPPWMNWYAILTMATPLISVVGVNDAMALAQDALASEGRTDLLIPIYGFLLIVFFVYCYPIARWTIYLERKYAVKI